jgi:hypothetical protein
MEKIEDKQQRDPNAPICEWCGQEIKKDPIENDFLTGVFGYQYCSKECEEEHICSK